MNLNKVSYSVIIAGALVVIALGITLVRSLSQEKTESPTTVTPQVESPEVMGLVRPPQPVFNSDERCTWVWKEISGVGIWAEKCIYGADIWDHEQGTFAGFNLTNNKKVFSRELEVFIKGVDEGMDSILARLQVLGVPATECVMEKNVAQSSALFDVFEIVPTGARQARMEASNERAEVPEDECGEYGVSANGQRFFQVFAHNPTKVIFINLGQDGSLLHIDSLTVTKM